MPAAPRCSWRAERGTSVGDAVATVETARRMRALPVADEAWRAGRLSGPQAAAVAGAAAQRPEAQRALVDAATHGSLSSLRRSCAEALARGVAADERERRVHARRSITHHDLPEGGFEMIVRGTHTSLATIRAGLATTHERVFQAARRQGRHERADAYLFDALELLCADAAGAGRAASGPSGPNVARARLTTPRLRTPGARVARAARRRADAGLTRGAGHQGDRAHRLRRAHPRPPSRW